MGKERLVGPILSAVPEKSLKLAGRTSRCCQESAESWAVQKGLEMLM